MNEDNNGNKISLKTDGIELSGSLADEFRPPIQQFSRTVDSVLRLINNIVGLPTDFLSSKLEPFRAKYIKELENISEDKLKSPSFRLGCQVIRHVAFSADEPDLQEMFATLLASDSNEDKQKSIHPGFASIINDITPIEAKILVQLEKYRRPLYGTIGEYNFLTEKLNINTSDIQISLSNLTRLGLVQKITSNKKLPDNSLVKIQGSEHYSRPRSVEDLTNMVVKGVNDLQKTKGAIISALDELRVETRVQISDLGRNFISTCLPEE